MTISDAMQPLALATRVERSLHRLGFFEIRVVSGDNPQVKLTGSISSSEELAIAIAATRCIPGVTKIQCDLQLDPKSIGRK